MDVCVIYSKTLLRMFEQVVNAIDVFDLVKWFFFSYLSIAFLICFSFVLRHVGKSRTVFIVMMITNDINLSISKNDFFASACQTPKHLAYKNRDVPEHAAAANIWYQQIDGGGVWGAGGAQAHRRKFWFVETSGAEVSTPYFFLAINDCEWKIKVRLFYVRTLRKHVINFVFWEFVRFDEKIPYAPPNIFLLPHQCSRLWK